LPESLSLCWLDERTLLLPETFPVLSCEPLSCWLPDDELGDELEELDALEELRLLADEPRLLPDE